MLTRPLLGLSLRLRVLLIFAGLAGAVLAAFALALMLAARRVAQTGGDGGAASGLLTAGVIGGFAAVLLITGVWYLFDRHVARPIEALAGGLRTGAAPAQDETRYLADLGPAARAAAEARARSAEALAEAVQHHAADLAREKATMESILSDIGAGAVLVDAGGRVVFYNASAARVLPGLALDRPLDRFLRPGALGAARARLDGGARATDLTCRSTGGVLLTGRMRPVDGGVVLILRDSPAAQPLPRAELEALRRASATLVPMLAAIEDGAPVPPTVARAIRDEGAVLARATRALSEAVAQDRGAPASASVAELATGLDSATAPPIRLAADAGPMNALLRMLDSRLREAGHQPRLTVAVDDDPPGEARLMLEWPGAALAMDRLEGWLNAAPDPDQPDLTAAEMLTAHATGIWSEEQGGFARIVLPLPLATGPAGADAAGGVTYDFALAGRAAASSRLADVTCVVFDTETTGLLPTDRIVQIAGLRIARGRLTGERFDTLVNPGRAIPAAATAVHRITDQMVADAPDMTAALTAFHHFAEGAVLVAHNAPFDMGMLHAAAAETGAHFDNRVLDTVLLSAMVYGQSATHSLDALTERLGIEIPPEARHTAMGDTIATAEAFLRLIPALGAKGLDRFEDVVIEAKKHRRLIGDANLLDPPRG